MTLLSGCVKEDIASLDGISAEPSYVSLGFEAGTKKCVIKTQEAWTLEKDASASWLTISPMNGEAAPDGVEVTFTMEETKTPRKTEVTLISGGKTQIITVGQNGKVDPVITSCKDFADDTKCPPGGMYYLEGFITKVEKYDYGNLYIKDIYGDEAYIYGVLDADGQSKNFQSLGIDVGDKVILYGLKKYYGTTLEMENATLIEVTVPAVFDLNTRAIRDMYKAANPDKEEEYSTYTKDKWKELFKADLQDLQKEGGDIKIPYTFKGESFEIEPGVDWIRLKGISQGEAGYVATLTVDPYDEDKAPRTTTLILKGKTTVNKVEKESNLELPVVQYGNMPAPSPIAAVAASGEWSTVLGKVVLANGKGVLVTDGKDVLYGYVGEETKLKKDDVITMTGKVTSYKGGLSMNKPIIKSATGTIADYTLPKPEVLTADNFADYVTPATPYMTPYLSITGVASVDSYKNVIIKIGDYSVKTYYCLEDYSAFDGKNVTLSGFAYNAYDDSKQVNLLAYDVKLVAEKLINETFAEGKGAFTIDDKTIPSYLTAVWTHDSSYKYMKATGYKKNEAYQASEGWLVSPLIDLTGKTEATLNFDHTGNTYFGTLSEEATLWAKKEADTEWTQLTIPYWTTQWDWINSGDINLSAFVGGKMQIAFRYTSTTAAAGTWEIKNVIVY